MSEILKFPNGFKWGSATSAHQIEGGNHNDWTVWEKSSERVTQLKKEGKNPYDFISGRACDSYNRYEEDFDIAKKLNQNIHRFSIEWSRIEPEEGKFNEKEIEHYKRLIDALRDRGIEPMVTLWHFTNPIWFANKGGFLNKKSPEYFTRYAKYVVDNLKDRVGLWITFNEASSVWAGYSYILRLWPPQHKNLFEYQKARKNFIKAHILAYREIKSVYDALSSLPTLNTGMSHNVAVGIVESNVYSAHGNRWYEKIISRIYNYERNLYFWDKALPYYDFLGLNYYHVDRLVPGSYRALLKQGWMPEMNWEIYPEGIFHTLKDLSKFKKPIFITENGIADGTDQLREKFIKEHLRWVWQAIHDGADVRGYMYWSLLDNFEWHRGFEPRFGLVEINPVRGREGSQRASASNGVDYATLERKIRPSAYEYARICLTNQLEID
ncbi:MAG: glycoside hydrolase family 1 protein [Candidatus Yanofskybacteria bacterium]|nr:glycoside hydrolase family 1 protein [Candidatus Yanofskybacteria bacterium]